MFCPDPKQVDFVADRDASNWYEGEPAHKARVVSSLQIRGREVGLHVVFPDLSPEAQACADILPSGWYRCPDAPEASWPTRHLAIEGLARRAIERALPPS